jgi:hypothetical protein
MLEALWYVEGLLFKCPGRLIVQIRNPGAAAKAVEEAHLRSRRRLRARRSDARELRRRNTREPANVFTEQT